MTGRCAEHGIALSPEGVCIVCRRNEAPPAPVRSSMMPLAISITVIALSGVGLYFAVQVGIEQLGRAREAVEDRPPMNPSELLPPGAPQELTPGPMAPSERGVHDEDRPSVLPALAPEDRGLNDEDTARARGRVQITLYSTSWCGYCRAAREYMDDRDIRYVEHDVERDNRAARRMYELNPRGSVPTFDIDGQPMIGFSERGLERAIVQAAAQRM